MGILKRLKTGLVLTKDSLVLIRHNPKLMLFPLVGGIAGLAFLALFLGVTFGVFGLALEGPQLALLFVGYLGLTFISTLFAAGLVHQTRESLGGGDPSLQEGLAAAWEEKEQIFVWSLIAATVSVILNMLESSDSIIARILAALFSVAWTLMTFFVVPVIVFEHVSTGEMFKRSANTFKQTWGETGISLIGVQIVPILLVLPAIAVGFLLVSANLAVAGVAVILVGMLLAFLLAQTLQGVVKTALYFYATEGKKPDEFDNVDFDGIADVNTNRSRRRGPTSGGFR